MQSSVFRMLRDATGDEAPARRWEMLDRLVEVEHLWVMSVTRHTKAPKKLNLDVLFTSDDAISPHRNYCQLFAAWSIRSTVVFNL